MFSSTEELHTCLVSFLAASISAKNSSLLSAVIEGMVNFIQDASDEAQAWQLFREIVAL